MNVETTINGPNGIYSFGFFILHSIITILNIAPIKKDIIEIIIIFFIPKNKPNVPTNLTSPIPIASFPATIPPIIVISKNIPPPTNKPVILSKAILVPFGLKIPFANVKISPTSNIFITNLLGIISYFLIKIINSE